jgi:hypothetical protein
VGLAAVYDRGAVYVGVGLTAGAVYGREDIAGEALKLGIAVLGARLVNGVSWAARAAPLLPGMVLGPGGSCVPPLPQAWARAVEGANASAASARARPALCNMFIVVTSCSGSNRPDGAFVEARCLVLSPASSPGGTPRFNATGLFFPGPGQVE